MPPEELNRRLPNSMRYMPRIVTNLDGQEHALMRKLLVKALNRKLVEDQRPFVRQRISQLLESAAARPDLEFHEGIARMLPGAVILKLLGMSQDYLPRLKEWADGVTAALTSFNPKHEWLDGLERVVTDMISVFSGEIEKRKQAPGADLITTLLQASEGGDQADRRGYPWHLDTRDRGGTRHHDKHADAGRARHGAQSIGVDLLARPSRETSGLRGGVDALHCDVDHAASYRLPGFRVARPQAQGRRSADARGRWR